MRHRQFVSALILVFASVSGVAAPPKNVILMIGDGMGFATVEAASMFEGKLGQQVFVGQGWTRGAVATHPLNLSSTPQRTGKQDARVVYDPAKAWAGTFNDGKWTYPWLLSTATDSAAAATAMATGLKTYNNAMSWSDFDKPLTNIHQIMKKLGKSTGVVSSVPWTHATPAAMVAHNPKRSAYAELGREMVYKSGVDVIMGAGHPLYDGNGKRMAKVDARNKAAYVGGWSTLFDLEEGRTSYRFIETKTDFAALAAGNLDMKGKQKVLGTAQTGDTLQQGRATKDWNGDGKVDSADAKLAPVGGDPFVKNVPSLATMTQGALNVLGKNGKGFFLMVEGGAIDWANHANQPARMIEEASDFFRAVERVSAWVEKNGGWKNNLVIVTADHETGLVLGPTRIGEAFSDLVDQGKGKLPWLSHNSGGHSNSLVPLFARGPGSERITSLGKRTDPRRGKYIENTDIFRLMTGR